VHNLIYDSHIFFVVFVKSCQTMGGAGSWNSGLWGCDLYILEE